MTRATILMTLGAVAITMVASVLATSPEILEKLWGLTIQESQELWERVKAGDDAARKEIILGHIRMSLAGGSGNAPAEILQIHIKNDGVPREKMVKLLDEIIREHLSIIGTELEAKGSRTYVRTSLRMLRELPSEDTLALFKEYAELGKDKPLYGNEIFSDVATQVYNRTLRILQEQANPTNDVPQNAETPPETKQESPSVIAPDTASVGRDNLGASSTNSPPREGN